MTFARSGHIDSFARDNLPPRTLWPEMLFTLPGLSYPERLNAAVELLDRHVAAGHGVRTAIVAAIRWGVFMSAATTSRAGTCG